MLQKVVARGLKDVVVCEDDAHRIRRLPAARRLSRDGITLLGGAIRTPGPWQSEEDDFRKSGACARVLRNMRTGVNEIDYDIYRWTGACSYYVPGPAAARAVLDRLENRDEKLTHFDVWAARHRLVKYLYYPNVFKEADYGSNIGTAANRRGAYRYCLWPEVRTVPREEAAHRKANSEKRSEAPLWEPRTKS